MRRNSLLAVVILFAAVGCASNKPLEPQHIRSMASIDVVRIVTPELQRHSPETIAGGGLLFGGFGMEAVAASAGKQLRERCNLEDLGALVVRDFVDMAPQQIPGWPAMRVHDAPVTADFVAKDVYLLKFQPGMVWLYTFGPKGFLIAMTATIASPAGVDIWRFNASYSQKEAGRSREIEELEAENCKLLKEEMQHASRALASQFVADLSRPDR